MDVRLVNEATALLSMRNSDFDTYSAYGEVVDNSIQADATVVKIKLLYTITGRKNSYGVVERIVFGDDGYGMRADVLHRCMQLGYSTRYNDRSGIGRFGVGMTLAAINQCRRVEIFSKEKNSESWLWTYVDLDEITSEPPKMEHIPEPRVRELPRDYQRLTGEKSGTIVVWEKYDRQPCDADEILQEMKIWFGRAYRKFIWKGFKIEVNGEEVKAIDPLYVTTKNTAFPDDPPAYEYQPIKMNWPVPNIDKPPGAPDESTIEIRMSLIDESFRPQKGSGGSHIARIRYIDRNEGITILRNDREVFFGHIPYWPGEKFTEIDRWWGCEISFKACLDRAFTVKNIKRGAVPAPELKQAIYEQITPTRKTAVEKVRDVWAEADIDARKKQREESGEGLLTGHEEAENTAALTKTDKSAIDKDKVRDEEAKKLVDEVKKDESEQKKAAWAIKFSSQPFTIIDEDWKGPEFFETNHLGGSDVIMYNCRHLFMETLYKIVGRLEISGESTVESRKLKSLIDLLLISYSKAEAKFESGQTWTADRFIETLRLNWGFYLNSYLDTWLHEEGERK
ncbi:MAG: ATP-binding protein [candidate division Zixibacteria bacterium]|nr:ATP-binding protein [candidate division Zixibacteria bacterium]